MIQQFFSPGSQTCKLYTTFCPRLKEESDKSIFLVAFFPCLISKQLKLIFRPKHWAIFFIFKEQLAFNRSTKLFKLSANRLANKGTATWIRYDKKSQRSILKQKSKDLNPWPLQHRLRYIAARKWSIKSQQEINL